MADKFMAWALASQLAWTALSEDPADLYGAIPGLLERFFGVSGGAFYARSGDQMIRTVQWGCEEKVSSFKTHECSALRPLRAWLGARGTHCRHCEGAISHFCVPVIGGESALGLLVVDGDVAIDIQAISAIVECLAAAIETANRCRALRHMATHDRKLGLLNKDQFEIALDAALSRSAFDSETVALLFIDLDHFKNYNDECGHLAGDMLLEAVAVLLRNSLRGLDFPARWGGEELVLVLVGADLAAATKRAEQIRRDMKSVPQVRKADPVTLSIGIAMYPQHGTNVHDLVAAADAAVYRAKSGGRDRIEIASDESQVNEEGTNVEARKLS